MAPPKKFIDKKKASTYRLFHADTQTGYQFKEDGELVRLGRDDERVLAPVSFSKAKPKFRDSDELDDDDEDDEEYSDFDVEGDLADLEDEDQLLDRALDEFFDTPSSTTTTTTAAASTEAAQHLNRLGTASATLNKKSMNVSLNRAAPSHPRLIEEIIVAHGHDTLDHNDDGADVDDDLFNEFDDAFDGGEDTAGDDGNLEDDFVFRANEPGSDAEENDIWGGVVERVVHMERNPLELEQNIPSGLPNDNEDEDYFPSLEEQERMHEVWRLEDQEKFEQFKKSFAEPEDQQNQTEMRELDKDFETVLTFYDDDEIGSLVPAEDDPSLSGTRDISNYSHILNEFIHDTRTVQFNELDADFDPEKDQQQKQQSRRSKQQAGSGVIRAPDGMVLLDVRSRERRAVESVNDRETMEIVKQRIIAEAMNSDNGDKQESTEVIEVEENPDQHWDCETILTTYSNLENHPTLIHEESTRRKRRQHQQPQQEPTQIKLSSKTGLPIVTLKPGQTTAEESRASGSDSQEEDGEEKAESRNLGAARPKEETKEEKRLRKQQLKEEKRVRRSEKKNLKVEFKQEQMRQSNALLQQRQQTAALKF